MNSRRSASLCSSAAGPEVPTSSAAASQLPPPVGCSVGLCSAQPPPCSTPLPCCASRLPSRAGPLPALARPRPLQVQRPPGPPSSGAFSGLSLPLGVARPLLLLPPQQPDSPSHRSHNAAGQQVCVGCQSNPCQRADINCLPQMQLRQQV